MTATVVSEFQLHPSSQESMPSDQGMEDTTVTHIARECSYSLRLSEEEEVVDDSRSDGIYSDAGTVSVATFFNGDALLDQNLTPNYQLEFLQSVLPIGSECALPSHPMPNFQHSSIEGAETLSDHVLCHSSGKYPPRRTSEPRCSTPFNSLHNQPLQDGKDGQPNMLRRRFSTDEQLLYYTRFSDATVNEPWRHRDSCAPSSRAGRSQTGAEGCERRGIRQHTKSPRRGPPDWDTAENDGRRYGGGGHRYQSVNRRSPAGYHPQYERGGGQRRYRRSNNSGGGFRRGEVVQPRRAPGYDRRRWGDGENVSAQNFGSRRHPDRKYHQYSNGRGVACYQPSYSNEHRPPPPNDRRRYHMTSSSGDGFRGRGRYEDRRRQPSSSMRGVSSKKQYQNGGHRQRFVPWEYHQQRHHQLYFNTPQQPRRRSHQTPNWCRGGRGPKQAFTGWQDDGGRVPVGDVSLPPNFDSGHQAPSRSRHHRTPNWRSQPCPTHRRAFSYYHPWEEDQRRPPPSHIDSHTRRRSFRPKTGRRTEYYHPSSGVSGGTGRYVFSSSVTEPEAYDPTSTPYEAPLPYQTPSSYSAVQQLPPQDAEDRRCDDDHHHQYYYRPVNDKGEAGALHPIIEPKAAENGAGSSSPSSSTRRTGSESDDPNHWDSSGDGELILGRRGRSSTTTGTGNTL